MWILKSLTKLVQKIWFLCEEVASWFVNECPRYLGKVFRLTLVNNMKTDSS